MKFNSFPSKFLTIVLIFSVIFSSFGLTTGRAASDYSVQQAAKPEGQTASDIQGHWAAAELNKWLQAGLLQGYANGQVEPDRKIARGELVALMNRSFGFTEKTEIAFTDLTAADWQYEDVSIAVKAGYLSGYENQTIRVHNEISRQEAAVMLGKVLAVYFEDHADNADQAVQAANAVKAFTDAAAIASWSKAAVQQLAEHNIISGYEDGSFKPLGSMTRAEAVTILGRALERVKGSKTASKSFDKAGVYGSADAKEQETIAGNVVITAPGVTLRNMIITGDLLLGEGIGEGDASLDNVTVQGATTVQGGGANSIHILNSVLAAVIIDKKTGTVRIVLEGSTATGAVTVRSSVILEEAVPSAKGFTSVKIEGTLPTGSKVQFKGNFTQVDVEASNTALELLQGMIDKLNIHAQAKGTGLKIEKDTKIVLLVLESIAKVLGQGTIEKASLKEQAKGSTFEKQPLSLEGANTGTQGWSGSGTGGNSTPSTPSPTGPPYIVLASAINGEITVILSKAPNAVPTIKDFEIEQSINGGPAVKISLVSVLWDASALKATISVVPVPLVAGQEQSVVYRVAYKVMVDAPPLVVAAEPINIVTATAVNGKITVTMNGIPNDVPNIGDFTVQRFINGGAAVTVTPTLVQWDAASKKATLSIGIVPIISELEQSVVYHVAYREMAPVTAAPVVVAAKLVIVDKGHTSAAIIVTGDANQQTLEAANKLSEYVRKSTGAALPIQTKEQTDAEVRIYVGTYSAGDKVRIEGLLQGMNDGDGYVIDIQDERNMTIVGPTSWGTEFGVSEFLERYVGIRWLMPGPDGEDVPHLEDISIPFGTLQEEPATISRQFFGMESPLEWVQWAKNNRMHEKIKFHHNMSNLFDTKKFKDHPEYYPGNVVPTHAYNWQPCFNSTTAAAAIATIKNYFANNPDEVSYSLGINDSVNFCEMNPSSPNYIGGAVNSLGLPNLSNVYYPWVNEVVEGVLAEYPDKYFGLLAYAWVYDLPENVELNPRIIPYITDDRMTWIDEVMGDAGTSHTLEWEQAAGQLGWYEYLYGSVYAVPRIYNHKMAENYKYAQEHGVVAHVAELYPNFGEGPKPWVSTKLQWNPDLDVDELVDEWYVRAVGEEAAGDLKLYYDFWEQFWTERIFDTSWYKNWAEQESRHTFMDFLDSSYLRNVTSEDLTYTKSLLESVVNKAQTAQQKKRAQYLLRAFDYYEASVLSFPSEGVVVTPQNEAEALALVESSVLRMEKADLRQKLLTEFSTDPVLRQPVSLTVWTGLANGAFAAIQNWMMNEPEDGAVRQRIAEIVATTETSLVRDLFSILLAVGVKHNLIDNPSFENGMTNWEYWREGAGSQVILSQDVSRTGANSIAVQSVKPNGGIYQMRPISPGKYAALAYYYVPEDTEARGEIQFYHNLYNADGGTLGGVISEKKLLSETKGRWASIEFVFELTENYNGGLPGNIMFGIAVWNQGEQDVIYIDDIALYKLD
ncbi:DUF4838 domain-containing protein [Paenibacillus eucommiae]|uniref:SLH domain-containing protein n=1 Tax=Paenibacillus eucommiae TaxID=1355755 RepID=A0ABS4IR90_9BACL|nr:DUF4838 domain-containing protein [Paenibacillus eucommiae]MBP1990082.1 hypothetical protein [Paenibacillus eucommiae]